MSAPKETHTRKRNDFPLEVLVESEELFGEPLPEGVLPKGGDWHPLTVKWWESMRRNPLLANEPEVGWAYLLDTAMLHHTMWTTASWTFAQELRQRMAKFGATPEDRLRLKIKVTPPPDKNATGELPESIARLEERRARLTGGEGNAALGSH